MSTITTTGTELPVLASPAVTAVPPETDTVEYPEGNWIAQSVAHGDAVRQASTALHHYFRERQNVLVAMELMVYFQSGNNQAKLQPDVQVVFGVQRGNRSSFKVWEEGKAPDFVLEVASPSTAENDAEHKAREYARIGVREYWRLDPQGSLLEIPLEGYELSAGQYERLQPVAGTARGGALRSRVLGLELRSERRAGATVLVFVDTSTGQEFDGTLEAAERGRRLVEREKQALQQQVRAAEHDKQALRQQVRAAEHEQQALRQRVSAADRERRAAEQRANAADERARALEERLRALAGDAPPPERHP